MTLKLLDCTLRDGGYDIDFQFGEQVVESTLKNMAISGVDIIEIGAADYSREEFSTQSSQNRGNTWRKQIQDFNDLAKTVKNSFNENFGAQKPPKIAIMIFNVDFPFDQIPLKSETEIDIVRVVLRYSELDKSLDLCRELNSKGYSVSINPAVTMRYTESELRKVLECANEINAICACIVDTYAYMTADDATCLYDLFNEILNPSIAIGFHAHNSLNLAFSNAKILMHKNETQNSKRVLIVDSTLTGMGQGSGNLQTELISNEMNENHNKNYSMTAILNADEEIQSLLGEIKWGYSVENLLGAINQTVYKYPRYFRREKNMNFAQINDTLKNLTDQNRHRFTVENAEALLKNSLKGSRNDS